VKTLHSNCPSLQGIRVGIIDGTVLT